jgi:lycopene cyclase domain-containing protein
MKEYTLIAAVSVVLTVLVDKLSKINIFKKKEFYLFITVTFGFKLLVNGYLTATNIVIYNPKFFLGKRLGSIPLEDFLFGFSMVSLGIILWEFFKREIR